MRKGNPISRILSLAIVLAMIGVALIPSSPVYVSVTAADAQNTYLFHRHYWHGIPDGGDMRDYVDAAGLDAGLTAVWEVSYPGDSCVPWLVRLGEDGYIENQKAIEVNQSTNKGCGVKIAKTSWGYVVIAGDHLVGLDNDFNVLWCKEPNGAAPARCVGGDVIVSDGDNVVIGGTAAWWGGSGAAFMFIDQSGKITGKETIHWWDGGFSDMIRDSSGNYVALGTGGDYNSNSRIVKLDSNLHTQWIIGGFGGIPDISFERVYCIVENSNGVYIAAGEGKWGWEGWQRKPWIMAIDKDGNVLWAKTYDSLNHLAFGDVVATQDGGLLFLVLGAKDVFGGGPVLLKTDAEGNPQWCKWYRNNVGYAKIVPADDGYYIVGSQNGRVDAVFGINRSEWLWYGSIFKVDLEGNIPSDAYEVEEWQVDPPQTWSNVTYENIEISHFSPEEWDPTFVDGDMPVTLQNEPKVATVFEYIPNKPPVVSFTYSPENPVVGQDVTFDASESHDPDGSIVSYEWDFGDGSKETTTSPTIQHSYSSAGTYTVTLTVTDNGGLTHSTSVQVEVTAATGTIQGKVLLQARTDHGGVQICADGHCVTTDSSGSFALEVPPGTYTVTARMPGYLSAEASNVEVTAGETTTLPEITLIGGDANGDDQIDVADLALIARNFGQTGQNIADINGDGRIDIFDLVKAGIHFGEKGPLGWGEKEAAPVFEDHLDGSSYRDDNAEVEFVEGYQGLAAKFTADDSFVRYPGSILPANEGAIEFYWKPPENIYELYSHRHESWTDFGTYKPHSTSFLLDNIGWRGAPSGSFHLDLHPISWRNPDSPASWLCWSMWSGSKWYSARNNHSSRPTLDAKVENNKVTLTWGSEQPIWLWDPHVWYKFTVTRGPKGNILYVNGKEWARGDYTGPICTSKSFSLGQDPDYWPYGPHSMQGTYDELKIYDRQITPMPSEPDISSPAGYVIFYGVE